MFKNQLIQKNPAENKKSRVSKQSSETTKFIALVFQNKLKPKNQRAKKRASTKTGCSFFWPAVAKPNLTSQNPSVRSGCSPAEPYPHGG